MQGRGIAFVCPASELTLQIVHQQLQATALLLQLRHLQN